jgi:hypothetical protein
MRCTVIWRVHFEELYESNSADECEKREEGLEAGSHNRSSGSDREGVAELVTDARGAGRRIEDRDEEARVRIAYLVAWRRRHRAAAKRPFGRIGVVEVRDEKRVGTIAISAAGAVGSGDILRVFGVHLRDLDAGAVRVAVGEAIHERGVRRVVDALHVGRVREIAERRLRPGHALHVARAEQLSARAERRYAVAVVNRGDDTHCHEAHRHRRTRVRVLPT